MGIQEVLQDIQVFREAVEATKGIESLPHILERVNLIKKRTAIIQNFTQEECDVFNNRIREVEDIIKTKYLYDNEGLEWK